jgi:hypothetical protein
MNCLPYKISIRDIIFDIKLSKKYDNWSFYYLNSFKYCNYGNVIEYFSYNKKKDKDEKYSNIRYYLICG